MTTSASIVIVGESLAGMTAAAELRRLGHTGPLTIVGDEPHPAYSRPPLSKQVLRSAAADDTLGVLADNLDAEIHRTAAVALDPATKRVRLANGVELGYDAAVIATGANARRLAKPEQDGELVLRTLDDAVLLRGRLAAARSAIVVGGGFLGMEVASACVKYGLPVTVVDADPPLRRLLGTYLSDLVLDCAQAAGVDVRVSAVELYGNPVRGVRFPNGSTLVADLVVTCAGDTPNAGWLSDSGMRTCRGGIVIDDEARTSVPDVYAAGDVVSVRTASGIVRRPFWANAVAQGRVVAHTILRVETRPPIFDNYFWTEILGTTIKVIGELPVTGPPEILEGDPTSTAILRWSNGPGHTVVAWGVKRPLPRLRALASAPTG